MNTTRNLATMLFLLVLLSFAGKQNVFAFSIQLTNPQNGDRFDSCADITLKAVVDIPAAEIKRVVFYKGTAVARTLRAEPWEYTMEGVADGIYELSARLTNSANEVVTSDTVQIFVGPVEDGEKLKNGEFSCGLAPWNLSLNEGAAATVEIDPEGYLSDKEPSMALIYIDNAGSANWHVMLTQPCPIDSGHTYEIYFMAEVEETKNVGVDFQSTTGTYPVYLFQNVEVTNDNYEYGPVEFFSPVTDPSCEFKLAVSENSQSIYLDAIKVIDKNWVKNTSGVTEKPAVRIEGFELRQNYPNPFNPSTEIQFVLPDAAPVTLAIYNVQGRLVKTLVDGPATAGLHKVTWDGRNASGAPAPSGIYIYKMSGEGFEMAKRMVLLK